MLKCNSKMQFKNSIQIQFNSIGVYLQAIPTIKYDRVCAEFLVADFFGQQKVKQILMSIHEVCLRKGKFVLQEAKK